MRKSVNNWLTITNSPWHFPQFSDQTKPFSSLENALPGNSYLLAPIRRRERTGRFMSKAAAKLRCPGGPSCLHSTLHTLSMCDCTSPSPVHLPHSKLQLPLTHCSYTTSDDKNIKIQIRLKGLEHSWAVFCTSCMSKDVKEDFYFMKILIFASKMVKSHSILRTKQLEDVLPLLLATYIHR